MKIAGNGLLQLKKKEEVQLGFISVTKFLSLEDFAIVILMDTLLKNMTKTWIFGVRFQAQCLLQGILLMLCALMGKFLYLVNFNQTRVIGEMQP